MKRALECAMRKLYKFMLRDHMTLKIAEGSTKPWRSRGIINI